MIRGPFEQQKMLINSEKYPPCPSNPPTLSTEMTSLDWRAFRAPAAAIAKPRSPWEKAPVPRDESDAVVASLSVHEDDSLGLYLALCLLQRSLSEQIPTAVATTVHASKVESWATALHVAVHDSDVEDARLLANSCGVGSHVTFSVDSRLQPSACFVFWSTRSWTPTRAMLLASGAPSKSSSAS